MTRRRRITATAPVGSHHASRARPPTAADIERRDLRLLARVRPGLPGSLAEVAARLGMKVNSVQNYLRQLVEARLVRLRRAIPRLRRVGEYEDVTHG